MAAELLLEQIRHVPEGESRVKRLIEPELIPGNPAGAAFSGPEECRYKQLCMEDVKNENWQKL